MDEAPVTEEPMIETLHEETLTDLRLDVAFMRDQSKPDQLDVVVAHRGPDGTSIVEGHIQTNGDLTLELGYPFCIKGGIQSLREITALMVYIYRTACRVYTERLGIPVDQLRFK